MRFASWTEIMGLNLIVALLLSVMPKNKCLVASKNILFPA